MAKAWPRVHSELDRDYRIFELLRERHVSPRTGRTIETVALESRDWVNVIALTPAEELVLIRQYRFGSERVTLEIPGGIVDPGESPAEAGLRELREETGYAALKLTALGSIAPNPAFIRNRLFSFLAEGCVLEGAQTQDASEDIEVELHPFAQIDRLLASGEIDHALVVVAFQKLALLRAGYELR